MKPTIKQLQSKIAELEQENIRLRKEESKRRHFFYEFGLLIWPDISRRIARDSAKQRDKQIKLILRRDKILEPITPMDKAKPLKSKRISRK